MLGYLNSWHIMFGGGYLVDSDYDWCWSVEYLGKAVNCSGLCAVKPSLRFPDVTKILLKVTSLTLLIPLICVQRRTLLTRLFRTGDCSSLPVQPLATSATLTSTASPGCIYASFTFQARPQTIVIKINPKQSLLSRSPQTIIRKIRPKLGGRWREWHDSRWRLRV